MNEKVESVSYLAGWLTIKQTNMKNRTLVPDSICSTVLAWPAIPCQQPCNMPAFYGFTSYWFVVDDDDGK